MQEEEGRESALPGVIQVTDGAFVWDENDKETQANLSGVNFEAKPGSLTMVGAIGAAAPGRESLRLHFSVRFQCLKLEASTQTSALNVKRRVCSPCALFCAGYC